jgi:hypothetical protein
MSGIIEIMKSVPEVKLKIIPLTWKLLGEDGRIDSRKASYDTTEVDAALDEAEDYARQTGGAVQRLKSLLQDKR